MTSNEIIGRSDIQMRHGGAVESRQCRTELVCELPSERHVVQHMAANPVKQYCLHPIVFFPPRTVP